MLGFAIHYNLGFLYPRQLCWQWFLSWHSFVCSSFWGSYVPTPYVSNKATLLPFLYFPCQNFMFESGWCQTLENPAVTSREWKRVGGSLSNIRVVMFKVWYLNYKAPNQLCGGLCGSLSARLPEQLPQRAESKLTSNGGSKNVLVRGENQGKLLPWLVPQPSVALQAQFNVTQYAGIQCNHTGSAIAIVYMWYRITVLPYSNFSFVIIWYLGIS